MSCTSGTCVVMSNVAYCFKTFRMRCWTATNEKGLTHHHTVGTQNRYVVSISMMAPQSHVVTVSSSNGH